MDNLTMELLRLVFMAGFNRGVVFATGSTERLPGENDPVYTEEFELSRLPERFEGFRLVST